MWGIYSIIWIKIYTWFWVFSLYWKGKDIAVIDFLATGKYCFRFIDLGGQFLFFLKEKEISADVVEDKWLMNELTKIQLS